MLWFRRYFLLSILTFVSLCVVSAQKAHAEPFKNVESITVMAEAPLAIPIAQITSLFARSHAISVSSNFGDAAAHSKKIEEGESADIFITSHAELIEQMKTKGLVDVYSLYTFASQGETTYNVAVVAGENMTPARVFLEFLKSKEAKEVLRNNGLTAP